MSKPICSRSLVVTLNSEYGHAACTLIYISSLNCTSVIADIMLFIQMALSDYYIHLQEGIDGSCPPADNTDKFRAVGRATDDGLQCIVASGDLNIPAQDLEDSGILDGLGLAIIFPSNGNATCTQSAKGTLLDYSIITERFLPLVQSCESVNCSPCSTHKGGPRYLLRLA